MTFLSIGGFPINVAHLFTWLGEGKALVLYLASGVQHRVEFPDEESRIKEENVLGESLGLVRAEPVKP